MTNEEIEAMADNHEDTGNGATADAMRELVRLRSDVAALTARRDELLALVVKITRETPYPAELDECKSARAKLIAEVGTLRSEIQELRGVIAPREAQERICWLQIRLDEMREEIGSALVAPAVSEERALEIEQRHNDAVREHLPDIGARMVAVAALPELLVSARQLHALLAALREVISHA